VETKARLLGHPIHQMLVVFPLGLLATSVVFDIIHFSSGSAFSASVAYVLIAAGLIAGALAAPFGAIDWLGIPPNTRAKMTNAARHGAVALLIMPDPNHPPGMTRGRQDR